MSHASFVYINFTGGTGVKPNTPMNTIKTLAITAVLIIILLFIVDNTPDFLRKIKFKLRPKQIQLCILTLKHIEEELWSNLLKDDKCDDDALFEAIEVAKQKIYNDSRNINILILSGNSNAYVFAIRTLLDISIQELSSGKHIYNQKYEPKGKGYFKLAKYCLKELQRRGEITEGQLNSVIEDLKDKRTSFEILSLTYN